VLDIDPATVVRKGRLQPGRMFLVDTAQGRIVEDDEIKAELAAEHPYEEWLTPGLVHLDDCPPRARSCRTQLESVQRRSRPSATPRRSCASCAPDGAHGGRGARLDGHRHADRGAVRPAAPAVRLLQAAVRAGHQPAARRDPRGARHLARHSSTIGPEGNLLDPARRRAARSCCRSRSSTTTSWPSSAHQRRRRPARLRASAAPSTACTRSRRGRRGAARARSTDRAPR
jgi:glutamate synthase (NADPH/NADH) large chain